MIKREELVLRHPAYSITLMRWIRPQPRLDKSDQAAGPPTVSYYAAEIAAYHSRNLL